MKKVILSLLAAAFALTTFAFTKDEIVGIWESKETTLPSEVRELTIKVKDKYNFAEDGIIKTKEDMKMIVNAGDGMFIDIFATFEGYGNYEVNDSTISIKYDIENSKLDVPQDKIIVRGCPDPDMAEQIQEAMYKNMAPNFNIQDMLESNMKIEMYLGNKMQLSENGLILTFTKKKK